MKKRYLQFGFISMLLAHTILICSLSVSPVLAGFVEEFDIPEENSSSTPSPRYFGTPQPGDTWTETITGMVFVWVPAGCFQMGSNSGESDEKPVHEVCLDGFWMAKYEVTNRQFRLFRSKHDSKNYKGVNLNNNDQPVVYVSWNDAKAFIQWLNSKTGQSFALPTEVQWEYAARGGTTTARFWGDDESRACQYANVHDWASKSRFSNFVRSYHKCSDGYAATSPIGQFKPNPFGLYDILGNVWEWCEDVYNSNAYSRHNRNNPLETSGGSRRVGRGGSWGNEPADIRCAVRYGIPSSETVNFLGFRLVRNF